MNLQSLTMKLDSLEDLFVDQIQDLYSAEKMIISALPKMIEKCSSQELGGGLQEHLEQTRQQVFRLDRIFDGLSKIDREKKKCKGMEGIIDEGEELLKKRADAPVRDAGIIASAQKVEHYEIAGYGTARTYAKLLGREDWAQLLQETLNEEKEADKKLNGFAERINLEAKAA
ncbi:MAG TPA: ferritin-like domain-containing protein [Terriglobales bacterium]|nr:ferritin-like domain-containing protein [Terriglobales bacterium]